MTSEEKPNLDKCCTHIPTICSVWDYRRKMTIKVFWDDSVDFGSFVPVFGRKTLPSLHTHFYPKKAPAAHSYKMLIITYQIL